MRNILTKEKLKDKSPRRQVCVEALHEEVQGHELRGHGNLGVEHRSRRDEEARELHLPQDLYKGEARTSRSTTLQISTRKCLEELRTQLLARKREPRILDGPNGDD